jgi:formiminotetrahydrofolate cyclodeaminase
MDASPAAVPVRDLPLKVLLESVGAKTPSPGGGAVASAAGALAAALGRMVVAYSVERKSLAEHRPALERALSVLERTADLLLTLADEDAAAYALLNTLQRLPETDPRRQAELPGAIEAAINAPGAVVAACADLLRLLESLRPITNPHLRSDLAIAAVLAAAAARCGWWNVKVNLPLLADQTRRQTLDREVRGLVEDASRRAAAIERACD